MKTSISMIAVAFALACAGCKQEASAGQPPQAKEEAAAEVSGAAPSVASAIEQCLTAGRDRWIVNPMPDADLAELWGGREWIREIKDSALRSRYQGAYDLYSARLDISARMLVAQTNLAAGADAPAKAREIEALMKDQYSTAHIEDMELDQEWKSLLEEGARKWEAASKSIGQLEEAVRPFATLAIEGRIYNDPFAVECGDQAVKRHASPGDLEVFTKAAAAAGQAQAPTP